MPLSKEKNKEYQKTYYQRHRNKVDEAVKQRRQERRVWFLEYKKDLSCKECGESHPACLEFHHKDRKDKDGDVNKMVSYGYAMETILAEMAKCEVLCSNCHRKLHWSERH